MATGDALKSTKAIYAAVVGALAPGAAYLTGVGGDGISGNEWILAGVWCLAGGAAGGLGVQRIENKPKPDPIGPAPVA